MSALCFPESSDAKDDGTPQLLIPTGSAHQLPSPVQTPPVDTPVSSPSQSKPSGTPTCYVDPHWPDQMTIPWENMPRGIQVAIRQSQRPNPADRRKMVRILVDAMRTQSPNPNRTQTATVAKRVVRKYPDCFEDRTDEGERMGNGFHSLVTQLKTRIENLNRCNLIARLRKPRTKTSAAGASPQPNMPVDAYGCISWQPDLPDGLTDEDLKAKQEKLRMYFEKDGPTPARQDVDTLMEDTYYLQRRAINAVPAPQIQEIQEAWPFLFWQRWLCLHFKLLTGVACYTDLLKAFEKKGERVRRYFESQGESAKKEVKAILQDMEGALNLVEEGHEITAAGVILLVMAHFKEPSDALILLADVSIQMFTFRKNLPMDKTIMSICHS